MKTLTAIILFWSLSAAAFTYEIVEPCASKAVYSGTIALSTPLSVGQATMNVLDAEKAPYIGSELGFNSILNTPTGDEAMTIVSDKEARFYGWCYEVDGVQPSVLAHEFVLKGEEHLRWFYGYALFKDGQWLEYCTPSSVNKPGFCERHPER